MSVNPPGAPCPGAARPCVLTEAAPVSPFGPDSRQLDDLRGTIPPMPAAPPDVAHLLENDAPAWARIDFDVLCSRCGYNLRTLTTPRCTECGLEFEWPHVLHQAGCRSEFLFEHNWRTRPIRSLFDTIWRARNPWRFWRSVSIHDRVHPRPLIFMLLFSPVVMWLVLMPLAAWLGSTTRWFWSTFLVMSGSRFGYRNFDPDPGTISYAVMTIGNRLNELTVFPLERPLSVFVASLAMVVAHLAAMALVLTLRTSFRRIRIRAVHILRVVCYSAGPISLWWALATVFAVCERTLNARRDEIGMVLVPAAYLIPAAVYLAVGAKRYWGIAHAPLLGFLPTSRQCCSSAARPWRWARTRSCRHSIARRAASKRSEPRTEVRGRKQRDPRMRIRFESQRWFAFDPRLPSGVPTGRPLSEAGMGIVECQHHLAPSRYSPGKPGC